jgi:hypothetical protein
MQLIPTLPFLVGFLALTAWRSVQTTLTSLTSGRVGEDRWHQIKEESAGRAVLNAVGRI